MARCAAESRRASRPAPRPTATAARSPPRSTRGPSWPRTFGEHPSDHLAHSPHEPQTLSGCERLAQLYILPVLGHLRLSDVTSRHLDPLYRRLEEQGSPGGAGPRRGPRAALVRRRPGRRQPAADRAFLEASCVSPPQDSTTRARPEPDVRVVFIVDVHQGIAVSGCTSQCRSVASREAGLALTKRRAARRRDRPSRPSSVASRPAAVVTTPRPVEVSPLSLSCQQHTGEGDERSAQRQQAAGKPVGQPLHQQVLRRRRRSRPCRLQRMSRHRRRGRSTGRRRRRCPP